MLLAETIDLCEDYFLVHFFGAKIFDYVTSFFLACAALRKLHVLKDHLSNSGLKNYLKTVRKSLLLSMLLHCFATDYYDSMPLFLIKINASSEIFTWKVVVQPILSDLIQKVCRSKKDFSIYCYFPPNYLLMHFLQINAT